MRSEANPLDLNNLPEEYGKQTLDEGSTTTPSSSEITRFKKKKSGVKEGKEESGKVYECRFCSLKFCKSQALGGHMNRHRQERETETLNRARQLVFGNVDSLAGAGTGAHMGLRSDLNFGGTAQPMQSGCLQHGTGHGDPCLHFRPVYPRVPTQTQPYLYSPSSSHPPLSYPPPPPAPHMSDYYIGRVLASNNPESNYPCYKATLARGFPTTGARGPVTGVGDLGSNNRTEGEIWNCSQGCGQHSDPSSVDRFRNF